MSSTGKALILTCVLLAAGACGSADEPDGRGQAASLYDGAWTLQSGRGPNGDIALLTENPVTLEIDRGRIRGVAACNSYNGRASISGSSFALNRGGPSMTEMGCARQVHRAEAAFMDALGAVDQISRSGQMLTLSGPGAQLTFEADPPPPPAHLVGTDWRLEGLVYGSGPEALVGSADSARLLLRDDGTFNGTTGCREVKGTWSGDEEEVTFHPQVDGACPAVRNREAPLRQQDAHVLSVLTGDATVEIKEGSLWLQATDTDDGLIYRVRS